MPRCPIYLNVDDFDRLAAAHARKLTDDGVSALGEIVEFIATQILLEARSDRPDGGLSFDAIVDASVRLGVQLDKNDAEARIIGANLRQTSTV